MNGQVRLRETALKSQLAQSLAEPDADVTSSTGHALIMAVGFLLRVGHALHGHPQSVDGMFNSKRRRLEEQLKAAEARIEQLKAQVENPLVPEQPEPDTITETLDRLAGPEGRKARIETELCLAVEQGERLQLALERLDALRLAQLKTFVGDSLQFAMALGVLRWLLRISWGFSIAMALAITVVSSLLYEVGKNSKRTLEVLVLERAERISEREGISLAEAQRRVEYLKWP